MTNVCIFDFRNTPMNHTHPIWKKLEQVRKAEPDDLPGGYFENLPDAVMAQVELKSGTRGSVRKILTPWMGLASLFIAGILLFRILHQPNAQPDWDQLSESDWNVILMEYSSTELFQYLGENQETILHTPHNPFTETAPPEELDALILF